MPLDVECSATNTTETCPEIFNGIPCEVFQKMNSQLGPLSARNLTTRFMNNNIMLNLPSEHNVEVNLNISIMIGKVSHFPRMIIEGSYLPPFIHPRCAASGLSDTSDIFQTRSQLLEPVGDMRKHRSHVCQKDYS